MADRLILHIGAPKTATSSIQSCLASNRAALAAEGILYPGTDINHVPEFLAKLPFSAPEHMNEEAPRRWSQLVNDVASHPGTVVLSSEIGCAASIEQGRAILADLDVPRTRIVITLRPLVQLLPSTWQEYVKSGDTVTYSDWLEQVFSGPPDFSSSNFWIGGNLSELVDRWTRIVEPDQVTIVILSPTQQDRIYRDFETIIGLRPGMLQPLPLDLANRSLTAGESELIRRVNLRLHGHQPGRHGYLGIPLPALWEMLRRVPSPSEPRLGVDPTFREPIERLSREFADSIGRSGCRIVGELTDICPPLDNMDFTVPSEEQITLEAAIELVHALITVERPTST